MTFSNLRCKECRTDQEPSSASQPLLEGKHCSVFASIVDIYGRTDSTLLPTMWKTCEDHHTGDAWAVVHRRKIGNPEMNYGAGRIMKTIFLDNWGLWVNWCIISNHIIGAAGVGSCSLSSWTVFPAWLLHYSTVSCLFPSNKAHQHVRALIGLDQSFTSAWGPPRDMDPVWWEVWPERLI